MDSGVFAQPVKVLVTGADGQVGRALQALAEEDGFFELIPLGSLQLDVTNAKAVRAQLNEHLPDYLINAAGFNDVDLAEQQPERCFAVNRDALEGLALACGDLGIPVLHLSTDYVFDGHYASGYTEDDEAAPLGVYGASKWAGEEHLRRLLPRHLILRCSWLFSEAGTNYVLSTLKNAAESGGRLKAVNDRVGCPTSAADAARVLLAIIKQLQNGADAWGTYHYSGAEVTTLYGFTEAIIAEARQYDGRFQTLELEAVASADYPTEAQRPTSSVLKCRKLLNTFGIRQRPWRNELSAVMRKIYHAD
ncbi:dTDP-4-dehydrorhamnose reductase [Marinobacterium arenosum]|uniref:dTDP-4-dehydrorhamnose reductase n=1 Tax=Marinobacterium arenosum TaxID=2862496 RepID=UPI001C93AE4C|nr:dTDP-4-dehydrorhamnose reductase [Marinobacterium arenosum]MBY4676839.1 dTDP-4-dehydrorhamnose reductase [Marinobacterium arenosum]